MRFWTHKRGTRCLEGRCSEVILYAKYVAQFDRASLVRQTVGLLIKVWCLDRLKIEIRLKYWENLRENCSFRCPTVQINNRNWLILEKTVCHETDQTAIPRKDRSQSSVCCQILSQSEVLDDLMLLLGDVDLFGTMFCFKLTVNNISISSNFLSKSELGLGL